MRMAIAFDPHRWERVGEAYHLWWARKLIQVWGEPDVLDTLAGQLGSAEGLIMHVWLDRTRQREAEAFLQKYGVR
jgi:hypothetical protein